MKKCEHTAGVSLPSQAWFEFHDCEEMLMAFVCDNILSPIQDLWKDWGGGGGVQTYK